jgi:MFS-type transporter involved in bile tolerance (Atg22 family)
MRSFLAILAGFFTVPIVSFTCDYAFHELHPGYVAPAIVGNGVALVVLLYGTFSVLIGGYVTGMISRKNHVRNGVILGVIGLAISIFVDIRTWHQAPAWYHILGLALVVPVSAYGSHLAAQRQQRRAVAA